jgi:outer membrane protein assembly factor BamB
MSLDWIYEPPHPPSPAWTESVRLQEESSFAATRRTPRGQQGTYEPATYDYCYYPVVSGSKVIYGSSTDEGVHCLDAASGKHVWSFYTEGAVRFAPHIADGKVYAGSDDGKVYCLHAADGKEIWSTRAAPNEAYCIGQNRPISAWPIRGGIAVAEGTVYCAAGVFPEQGVYAVAMNAETGQILARESIYYVASGATVVDGDLVWIPTHRTAPTMIHRDTMKPVYPESAILHSRGSALAFKVAGRTAWGPGEAGLIHLILDDTKMYGGIGKGLDDYRNRKQSIERAFGVMTILYGTAALADDDMFILVGDIDIRAVQRGDLESAARARSQAVLSRKEKVTESTTHGKMGGLMGTVDALFERRLGAVAWERDTPERFAYVSAILTGGHLVLGSKDTLTVMDKINGETVWTATVDGTPWGLAAADGALYAATDKGLIYAFRPGASGTAERTSMVKGNRPFKDSVAARDILEQADRNMGLGVVISDDAGQLAYHLAKASDFLTIVFEKDAAKADIIRQNLVDAGVYGTKAVVRVAQDDLLKKYPLGIANIAVAGQGVTAAPADIMRLVQPYGGTLAVEAGVDTAGWKHTEFEPFQTVGAWEIARRRDVAGGGTWPHGSGTVANPFSSQEKNLSADGKAFKLQWFGKPYAYDIVDRHHVPMSPLFQNGVVFLAGRTNSLTAVDAYNGTILWKIHQPESLRMWAGHNASPISCSGDGEHIFASTTDECWMLDAITGEKRATFTTGNRLDWGYSGSVGSILIGTSQGHEADLLAAGLLKEGRRSIAQPDAWKFSRIAAGKDIFAVDYTTGKRLWTYDKGLILAPTICIADGKVFFGESRNETAMDNTTGYINYSDWLRGGATDGPRITALDLKTGKTLWTFPMTRNIDKPNQWLMCLQYRDGILLKTRSYFNEEQGRLYRGYDYEALEADTGKTIWQQWVQSNDPGEARYLTYGKNTTSSWPILIGERFYIRTPFFGRSGTIAGYDLRTGERFFEPREAGTIQAGCSPAIGCANALYYRSYHHVAFDIEKGEQHELTGVTRPSCWPNILPVGGLLVMPEGGSGCSCGLSYQLSFALAPKDK